GSPAQLASREVCEDVLRHGAERRVLAACDGDEPVLLDHAVLAGGAPHGFLRAQQRPDAGEGGDRPVLGDRWQRLRQLAAQVAQLLEARPERLRRRGRGRFDRTTPLRGWIWAPWAAASRATATASAASFITTSE